MQLKKDILVRTYLVFILMGLFCIAIIAKVIYIQRAEGNYWIAMADSAHIRYEEVEAERGTIYSEDGQMLSTSVPEFDIFIDFQAEGLRDRRGLLFNRYLDSLSHGLANLFNDKSAATYQRELKAGYRSKSRYALFKRKISFPEYEALQKLPLVRLGRNKSGFIYVVRMKRLYPFRVMANRTIGIARESNKVGLEKKYDKYLSGVTGNRLVRYIAGGAGVPVEGSEVEPMDGLDMITTLDIGMQDAAQIALNRMMIENEAERGTCIVLEVKTGKVKAIANLGRQADGSYYEDYNYALSASEPGSTWKLVTLLSSLEDKKVSLTSTINLEGGRWKVAGQTVYDSEIHGMHEATVKQAFEKSSNVGMAKLAYGYYANQPSVFINHIKKLHLDSLTGIDLPGEAKPDIHKPGSRWWSKTTLPWMGFGYNLTSTPLHTAMLYNAIANGGAMMRPYLVNALLKDGVPVQSFSPVVLNAQVCSPETLGQLKACLEGVVLNGTARKLRTEAYPIAGKTGTALVADKGITYADKVYQSSFAGYFPADNPQYTIVVVIRNKQHAARFYGGDVAGPVFREVADRIFSNHIQRPLSASIKSHDSVHFTSRGRAKTMVQLNSSLRLNARDSSKGKSLATLATTASFKPVLKGETIAKGMMPDITGFGLKDALDICEANKLKVKVKGKGKVISQSIAQGSRINSGQVIQLLLN